MQFEFITSFVLLHSRGCKHYLCITFTQKYLGFCLFFTNFGLHICTTSPQHCAPTRQNKSELSRCGDILFRRYTSQKLLFSRKFQLSVFSFVLPQPRLHVSPLVSRTSRPRAHLLSSAPEAQIFPSEG